MLVERPWILWHHTKKANVGNVIMGDISFNLKETSEQKSSRELLQNAD